MWWVTLLTNGEEGDELGAEGGLGLLKQIPKRCISQFPTNHHHTPVVGIGPLVGMSHSYIK